MADGWWLMAQAAVSSAASAALAGAEAGGAADADWVVDGGGVTVEVGVLARSVRPPGVRLDAPPPTSA